MEPFHSKVEENPRSTLGEIVRTFKGVAARQIHLKGIPEFGWQRNYYDRVIRSERELFEVRRYIQENPLKWDLDPENPNRNPGRLFYDVHRLEWEKSEGAINRAPTSSE